MLAPIPQAEALVDLGQNISVKTELPKVDVATGEFIVNGTLHNSSNIPQAAPITLVVDSFNPADSSIALIQSDGALPDGDAFKVILAEGELAANADLSFNLRFGFANPISSTVTEAIEKAAKKAFQFSPSTKAGFTVNYKVTQIPAGNRQPVANAGADLEGKVEQTITLNGGASNDPDLGQTLGYAWTLTEIPPCSAAKLIDSSAVNAYLTADAPGVYVASLIVNDGYVLSNADTVKVTVNQNDSGNHQPKISSTPGNSGTDTREYNYKVEAGDADCDTLTYKLTEFPQGMTINATGSIGWKITGVTVGSDVPVTVEVSDGHGGVTEQKFTIKIMPCSCSGG